MLQTEGRGFKFEWGKYRFKKSITPSKTNFIEGTPTVLKIGGASSQLE